MEVLWKRILIIIKFKLIDEYVSGIEFDWIRYVLMSLVSIVDLGMFSFMVICLVLDIYF